MVWKKVDKNQSSVVKSLRQCGFSVAVTSMIGKGFPDLVIGVNGIKGKENYLIELKNEKMRPSKRKLTDDEQDFKDGWKGKYFVCKNLEEILKIINGN